MNRSLRILAVAASLAVFAAPAMAQSAGGGTPPNTTVSSVPASNTGALGAVTATTTSAQLFAANASRKYMYVENVAPSNGGTVAVCPASVTNPAPNIAGCKTLYPGGYWAPCSGSYCPADLFNVIATASTPLLAGQN